MKVKIKCPICKSNTYQDNTLADHLQQKHPDYQVARCLEDLLQLELELE